MHHFVTEMCTCVHISVTECCIVGCLSNALWDLWDGSIMKCWYKPYTWRLQFQINAYSCVLCGIDVDFFPQLRWFLGCWQFPEEAHQTGISVWSNTSRLRQNGCHFADNIFNFIFCNENYSISNQISLAYFYPAALKAPGYCRTPSGRAGGRAGGRADKPR